MVSAGRVPRCSSVSAGRSCLFVLVKTSRGQGIKCISCQNGLAPGNVVHVRAAGWRRTRTCGFDDYGGFTRKPRCSRPV